MIKEKRFVPAAAAQLQERSLHKALPMDIDPPHRAPRARGSAAGRAILHQPGISLPGAERMRRR
ncbi:MAG: hypothetical protein IJ507_01325 [Clostridia bacterium]|nr:hypothetical protein [Clostridia bacterium]